MPTGLIIFVGFVTLIIGFVVGHVAWVAIRRKKLREFAEQAGFQYAVRDISVRNRFPFQLFDKGDSSEALNVIKAPDGDGEMAICDFVYTVISYTTTGTGSNRSRRRTKSKHAQTVCLVSDAKLCLPEMFIRRERLFDWLGEKFGGQDIDFDEDHEFSDAFVVQGSVEDRIREVLDKGLRRLFLDYRHFVGSFEANDTGFMVNIGKRLAIDKFKDLISFAHLLHRGLEE
ncbi:hypothetical protein ACFL4W_02805 [Planctomycetota bacterium]